MDQTKIKIRPHIGQSAAACTSSPLADSPPGNRQANYLCLGVKAASWHDKSLISCSIGGPKGDYGVLRAEFR
jgi:hypothetical protein